MPEKSIERFEVAYIQGGAVNRPEEKGRYVKYADHLAALGEAEKELERYRAVFGGLCWRCGGSGEIPASSTTDLPRRSAVSTACAYDD